MDIDRRQLLVGTICSALTGAVGGRGISPSLFDPDVSGAEGWHPEINRRRSSRPLCIRLDNLRRLTIVCTFPPFLPTV